MHNHRAKYNMNTSYYRGANGSYSFHHNNTVITTKDIIYLFIWKKTRAN